MTVYPQQARGCVELPNRWPGSSARLPSLPCFGLGGGSWGDGRNLARNGPCTVFWLARDLSVGPHFGSGQSRPPRPHMLHGRLSLPLTPISIFPTTNSPRPHRQSQDQTRTATTTATTRSTTPIPLSAGSHHSPSVKPSRPTPHPSSRNTASPRLATTRPTLTNIVRHLHRTDIDIGSHPHRRRPSTLTHLHLQSTLASALAIVSARILLSLWPPPVLGIRDCP